jgi:Kef-type K+ transport system membrane component KefB
MDRSLLQLPVQDPVLIFGIAMTAILLAPLLFTRLRMPGVIGIIVVGVIIGPNGLNILERSESIVLLGTVGLLYIMFTAGLDIDMNQFLRNKYHSLVFGTLTFVIPMLLGTTLFLWMGFGWTAAILIASMFASHTLVAYPVVKRLGIARDPAVTTAVGGTILTDTAALLVLAVVARSAQ